MKLSSVDLLQRIILIKGTDLQHHHPFRTWTSKCVGQSVLCFSAHRNISGHELLTANMWR